MWNIESNKSLFWSWSEAAKGENVRPTFHPDSVKVQKYTIEWNRCYGDWSLSLDSPFPDLHWDSNSSEPMLPIGSTRNSRPHFLCPDGNFHPPTHSYPISTWNFIFLLILPDPFARQSQYFINTNIAIVSFLQFCAAISSIFFFLWPLSLRTSRPKSNQILITTARYIFIIKSRSTPLFLYLFCQRYQINWIFDIKYRRKIQFLSFD